MDKNTDLASDSQCPCQHANALPRNSLAYTEEGCKEGDRTIHLSSRQALEVATHSMHVGGGKRLTAAAWRTAVSTAGAATSCM
eukprot:1160739-Pelagomonas_calceolata.AAC.4